MSTKTNKMLRDEIFEAMATVPTPPEALRIHTTIMERYVYIWSIKELSQYLNGKRQTPIVQKIYMRNGDMEWVLKFYPKCFLLERHECNCRTPYRKHYIRLEAQLVNSSHIERIENGKLQVVNSHHVEVPPKSSCEIISKGVVVMNIEMESDALKKSALNDEIKLIVTMKITAPLPKIVKPKPGEPMKLIKKTFKELPRVLQNKSFVDTAIVVGNVMLPTHQSLLSGASPIFAAMLENDSPENNLKRIEITDFDFEVTNELVKFIYSRKTPDFKKFDKKIVHKILEAACKYVVDDLKVVVADFLGSDLSAVDVMDVLLLADEHKIDSLKEKAIEFICANNFHFSSLDQYRCFHGRSHLLAELLLKSFASKETEEN